MIGSFVSYHATFATVSLSDPYQEEYKKLLMKFSTNLKQIRDKRSLTQRDVAILCGMDEQNYRRIENIKVSPSLKSLMRISLGLGLSISELLGESKRDNG